MTKQKIINNKKNTNFKMLKITVLCDELYATKLMKSRLTEAVNIVKIIVDSYFNPLPYLRLTQGSKYSQKAKKYRCWKQKIYESFVKQTGYKPKEIFSKDKGYRLFVKIFTKDDTGGDPDNIRKAVSDAIWSQTYKLNDKKVEGDERMYRDAQNPRLEIVITNPNEKHEKSAFAWLLNKDALMENL